MHWFALLLGCFKTSIGFVGFGIPIWWRYARASLLAMGLSSGTFTRMAVERKKQWVLKNRQPGTVPQQKGHIAYHYSTMNVKTYKYTIFLKYIEYGLFKDISILVGIFWNSHILCNYSRMTTDLSLVTGVLIGMFKSLRSLALRVIIDSVMGWKLYIWDIKHRRIPNKMHFTSREKNCTIEIRCLL